MSVPIYCRLVSISKRPKETTAQPTKSVLTAIKNMIKLIEVAPLLNDGIDYKPLFSELNQFFADYKNMINKRLLLNKKKANKSDNQESSESTEITDTSQIKKSEEKIQHDSDEKDYVKLLDMQPVVKEKTAAMASKNIQLPIVSDADSDAIRHDAQLFLKNRCALGDG